MATGIWMVQINSVMKVDIGKAWGAAKWAVLCCLDFPSLLGWTDWHKTG